MKDLWGNLSSGALVKLLCLFVAIIVANLGVIMGVVDLGQVAVAMGVFLTAAAVAQVGATVQGSEGVTAKTGPLGFLQNVAGFVDSGRLLKVIAFVAAVELTILVVVLRASGLGSVPLLAGPFLTLALGVDVLQKATGT